MATIAKNSTVSFAKPMLFIEAPKAKEAIEFYKSAFDAVELSSTFSNSKRKYDHDSPLILRCELQIGSSTILITDYAYDDYATPLMTPGNGFVMRVETPSVHASWSNAILSGAKTLKDEAAWFGDTPACTEPMRQVIDPFGFIWMFYPTN